jgi:hypothetical protein
MTTSTMYQWVARLEMRGSEVISQEKACRVWPDSCLVSWWMTSLHKTRGYRKKRVGEGGSKPKRWCAPYCRQYSTEDNSGVDAHPQLSSDIRNDRCPRGERHLAHEYIGETRFQSTALLWRLMADVAVHPLAITSACQLGRVRR